MKAVKNIYKLSSLCALMFATGCSDEYEQLNLVSDTAWYNSEAASDVSNRYQMSVGEYISFMDASQGLVSREWKINSETAVFLADSFDPSDDAEPQVDPSKGDTSSNAVEAVYFTAAGPSYVTLTGKFNEWVGSHDNTGNEATFVDGYWEIVTEYQVNVFSPLEPAFRLYTLDDNGDVDQDFTLLAGETQSPNKIFYIETGDIVYCEDLTTEVGFPEDYDGYNSYYEYSRAWTVTGSKQGSSTEANPSFSFSSAGTYSGFKLATTRSIPSNTVSKTIPVTIKVSEVAPAIKSAYTSPVANNIVVLATNSELSDVLSSGFSISVADAEGNTATCSDGSDYSITSVAVDADNSMNINVTLSDYLYEGDIITISYDATTSSIYPNSEYTDLDFGSVTDKSVTNTISEQFTSALLKVEESTDTSFANASTASLWWTGATSYFERALNPYLKSLYMDYVDYEDDYVVMFNTTESGIPTGQTTEVSVVTEAVALADLVIPAGNYIFSYNIYFESDKDMLDHGVDYNSYILQTKNSVATSYSKVPSASDANAGVEFPTGDDRNKWVTQQLDVTYSTSVTSVQLKWLFVAIDSSTTTYANKSLPAGIKIYIDDVKLTPVRPTSDN
ncbi:MAG: hypothetical protein SNG27_08235 [Rikenellaceae bacterium]